MTADQPRPKLADLFDAVAALPAMPAGSRMDLCLHDSTAGADLRAWAAAHSHVVNDRPLYTREQGAWTLIYVLLPAGMISVHLERVAEQPEAAERRAL